MDILYIYEDMPGDLVDAAVKAGTKGIVAAGVGNGNMPKAVMDALARAAKGGVVVVRASRVTLGFVGRNVEVDDDKLNFVAAEELNPPKARVLLRRAHEDERSKADSANVQRILNLKLLTWRNAESRMKTITGDFVGIRWRLAVLLWGFTLACAGQTTPADPKPWLQLYGFAMMDMGYEFKQTHPDWFDVVRPTKLPQEERVRCGRKYLLQRPADRFGAKSEVPTALGPLSTIFEFELFGTGVDAGQTTFRLRHAYGELGQFGAGQTWSPFMDIDVFPNSVEYWGPTGMVFSETCNSGGCRSRARLASLWPWNGLAPAPIRDAMRTGSNSRM